SSSTSTVPASTTRPEGRWMRRTVPGSSFLSVTERSARTVPIDVVVLRCSRRVATAAVTTSAGSARISAPAPRSAAASFHAATPPPRAKRVRSSSADLRAARWRSGEWLIGGSPLVCRLCEVRVLVLPRPVLGLRIRRTGRRTSTSPGRGRAPSAPRRWRVCGSRGGAARVGAYVRQLDNDETDGAKKPAGPATGGPRAPHALQPRPTGPQASPHGSRRASDPAGELGGVGLDHAGDDPGMDVLPLALRLDEPGLDQLLQVMRDGGLGDGEPRAELLVGALLAARDGLEQREAPRVGEGLCDALELTWRELTGSSG